MLDFLAFLLRLVTAPFRAGFDREVEVLVLRQQLAIYQRSVPRPRLRLRDRLFWCWLSRLWSRWKDVLVIVRPATVIAWRRRKFREYWAKLSGRPGPGRPPVPKEIQDLIRRMSEMNVTWGSPRIVSELRMVGIEVAKSTVERYMLKRPKPASPTWRAFLANHVACLASIDFFVVPTMRNRILYAFVVLAHLRRRIVHFAVTEHPTAAWTARQVTEAFPWDTAPRHMIRDRQAALPMPSCARSVPSRMAHEAPARPCPRFSPRVCSLRHQEGHATDARRHPRPPRSGNETPLDLLPHVVRAVGTPLRRCAGSISSLGSRSIEFESAPPNLVARTSNPARAAGGLWWSWGDGPVAVDFFLSLVRARTAATGLG